MKHTRLKRYRRTSRLIADKKRRVRRDSDRLITKHVQEHGVFYNSDERRLNYSLDDEFRQEILDDVFNEQPESDVPKDRPRRPKSDKELADERKQRLRKQAEKFREAEAELEEDAESIRSVIETEVDRTDNQVIKPAKTRLNHSDEHSSFIHGAGSLSKRALSAAAAPVRHYLKHEIKECDEDNSGVQSIKSGTSLADRSIRRDNVRSSRNSRKRELKKAEHAAQTEKRKKDEIRAFMKKKRHRAAVEAKKNGVTITAGGFVDSAKSAFTAPAKAKKAARTFFSEHKGSIMSFAVSGILFGLFAVALMSVAALVQGGGTTIIETTYTGTDSDIYAAENTMCSYEDALNAQILSFEKTHPGYDEYVYQVDEFEHNPYNLISYLQVKYGEFTCSDTVKAEIKRLFREQYTMSVSETSETRTRREMVTKTRRVYNPSTQKYETEEYEVEEDVPYEYKTITCILTNKGFDIVARNNMDDEETLLYNVLNRTFGNRDYLFDKDSIGISPGAKYDIPPEALSDAKFAAMIREAEKYLGYPYVLGGKSPRTSFDCSGFVCWVINHCDNNWNVGNKRAKELCRMCIYVSPQEARPGDLIFFEKTYETSGASHVGIYVGNGMMLHCGNPIKYSSINTRYFKEHFLCFGRLPFYDK